MQLASNGVKTQVFKVASRRLPGPAQRRPACEVRTLSSQFYVKDKSSWVELVAVRKVGQYIYEKKYRINR